MNRIHTLGCKLGIGQVVALVMGALPSTSAQAGMKRLVLTVMTFALLSSLGMAQTSLQSGGDIRAAGGWTSGLPTSGNPGTIAVNGSLSGTAPIGYSGATITHTAGTIAINDGFNFNGGDTWNMSGGRIDSFRFFGPNQASTVFNLSGGTLQQRSSPAPLGIQVVNSATLNVSGSGTVIAYWYRFNNGTPTMNFDPNWTGSWTDTTQSGTSFRTLLAGTAGFEYDGADITAASFDANFEIIGETNLQLKRPQILSSQSVHYRLQSQRRHPRAGDAGRRDAWGRRPQRCYAQRVRLGYD